jgi:hypothetical protein
LCIRDRFVAGMRATIEPWLGEPVSDGAARAARRWAAERRARWERGRPAEHVHSAVARANDDITGR